MTIQFCVSKCTAQTLPSPHIGQLHQKQCCYLNLEGVEAFAVHMIESVGCGRRASKTLLRIESLVLRGGSSTVDVAAPKKK